MVAQSRKSIELIVRTLLNEERIHTETAKSILLALDGYEGEMNEVFSKGTGLFFEKAFNYERNTNFSAASADHNKETSGGQVETERYKYTYTITRIPKR